MRARAAEAELAKSQTEILERMAIAADIREDISGEHGFRVGRLSALLARELGWDRDACQALDIAARLHDIGKIGIPEKILLDEKTLREAEKQFIAAHTRVGAEILSRSDIPQVRIAEEIARCHHEWWDGSGYPKGLKGDEISIYGRMAGIADSFAALITPRPYANPLAPQDALMSLYQWAGSSFHAPLVEHFVQAVGVFPVGGLCELSSGEVAVVLAHNRVRRLEPKVLVLTTPDKRPLAEPIQRDLLTQKTKDASGRNVRIMRGLSSGAYGLKLRDIYAHESTSALLRTA